MPALKPTSLKARHHELFALVKANRGRLAIAMLCMLVTAGSTAALAWVVKPVIDDIFVAKDLYKLKILPFAVVLIYLLRGLAVYGQEFFMNHVGQGIVQQIRNRLYHRIIDLPLAFFHQEKTGALMSRITYDVNLIKAMVSSAVAAALRDAFSILGLIVVILLRNWTLACIALLVLPMAYLPLVFFGRLVRRNSTSVQEAMADLSTFLHETFAGNKIVKAFGMEPYEKRRYGAKTARIFAMEMKLITAKALSSPVMEFLGSLGVAFIIFYGGYQVINGVSTTGTFFSFMTAVIMLYEPVKKLTKINNVLQEGLAATDRIFEIIERQSEIKEAAAPQEIQDGSHAVRFKNVAFTYGQQPVLTDINLEVKAGEILAIVGMSGGGKTSLVNLIPRFYDVTQGAICVDDLDIRDAAIASLRKQIAIVTQEPILFNDTVRNNIAYGNPAASEKEIIHAAQAAYAHDFIEGFTHGYETTIGELGSRLSGGEKQRICIARALLKDAPILILDEATSSLDSEAELLVQKALENLMRGRTTFIIAHRLSTISYADRVIVMVGGQIVEEGRQEDLLERKGEYYRLHQMQFGANQQKM